MEHVSFEKTNLYMARRLLKNICVISNSYAEKKSFMHKLGIEPKKYEPYTSTESALRARIHQLEEGLLKVSEERDIALEENRTKIDLLQTQIITIKDGVRKLIKAKMQKEKRIMQLEKKIGRIAKIKS